MNDLARILDAKLFKLLSEPARIELLMILATHERLDISALSSHLPQERSVVSRHLSAMCEGGLLHSEKQGRHTFYQVDALAILERLETMSQGIRAYFEGCCPDMLKEYDNQQDDH